MSTVPEFTERLRAAAERIRADAPRFGPDQRTAPDPATGEQWDRGQVLAHVAEMVPYWIAQVELVLAAGGNGAPFGRVKSDPDRIAAIEEDRGLDPDELLDHIDEGVDEAVKFMRRLTPADLACTGRHSTLGVMNVSRILDDFLVGHLEEHADQLLAPDLVEPVDADAGAEAGAEVGAADTADTAGEAGEQAAQRRG